jgi:predicted ester cyclase
MTDTTTDDERAVLAAAIHDGPTIDLLLAMTEVWNTRNIDAIPAVFSPAMTFNGFAVDHEGLRAMVERQWVAFPDFHLATRHVAYDANAHLVTLCMHWTGTHRGTYQSRIGVLPATGAAFATDGIEQYAIADGRIAAGWAAWDLVSMLQAFGAIPTPS